MLLLPQAVARREGPQHRSCVYLLHVGAIVNNPFKGEKDSIPNSSVIKNEQMEVSICMYMHMLIYIHICILKGIYIHTH